MKILYPLSLIYNLGISCRLLLYKYKIFKSYKFDIPIISIGNITMGGTGKTPMVLWLVDQLKLKNITPCIITRGYKRKSNTLLVIDKDKNNYTVEEIGDEPLMILKKNKDIQMVVYNDKIKAIQAAIKNLIIDVIILDDGFQSLYIDRDLDLVMINAKIPRYKYNLFPWGDGREPITGLERADAVITTRGEVNSHIRDVCLQNRINIFQANEFFSIVGENGNIINNHENLRVIAVCGIADPEFFLTSLNNYKLNVAAKFIVPDHYRYRPNDMENIYQNMGENNCNAIITTWKDYEKINLLNLNNEKIIILDMKLELKENTILPMVYEALGEN